MKCLSILFEVLIKRYQYDFPKTVVLKLFYDRINKQFPPKSALQNLLVRLSQSSF